MIDMVIEYFSGTLGKVELAGTVFSLICVYLAVKHNMLTWFFGILGVLCFGYLFYEYKLYSDAGLQILFFLPMQFLGYYWWKKAANENDDDEVVLSLTYGIFALVLVGIGAASLFNGYFMSNYTDASFPYADALTTWMSIAAQILMIMKFRESWVLWVSMDVIAIKIYYEKELYVTSGLYVIFLAMASYGLYKWYKGYAEQKKSKEEIRMYDIRNQTLDIGQ